MKIRLWTLITAFVIVLAFGLALPHLLSNKAATVAISYEQVKADFKAEFIEGIAALNYEASETEVTETTTQVIAEATTAAEDTPVVTTAIKPGVPKTSEAVAQATTVPATTTALVAEATELGENDTPLGGGEDLHVKDGWVNEKINENKDKISTADLERGAAIYNTLDTDFIFGLADNGLTDEERKQVDDYLRSQLSGGDYELAKALYNKYVGLLTND